MIKKVVVIIIFLIGLLYLILPSPQSISEVSALPGSLKSDLPGDTWQNPNIAAYFSNYTRDFVTKFYRSDLAKIDPIGAIIPPMRLNHPVEDAFQYIRDQQESTFLEEYIYPFRESLFVNGYEPRLANGGTVNPNDYLTINGQAFNAKTTIRLYQTSLWKRLLVYLGIWVVGFWIYKLFMRARKEKFA